MKDTWEILRRRTPARIALGRAGGSLPTAALLDFRLAHARAVDAVYQPFDVEQFAANLNDRGVSKMLLTTAVHNKTEYLARHDLGGVLSETSFQEVKQWSRKAPRCDLVIVISDGLSTLAVERQVPPLLDALLPLLTDWNLAPLMIVGYARVALQDQLGEIVGARLALTLIGERPGLIAPDSLSAYFVYGPKPGNTSAKRNCVSNIRSGGLEPVQAASTIHYLLTQSRQRQLSGVHLKDESGKPSLLG